MRTIEKITPVKYKGIDAELFLISELKILNTASRFATSKKEKVYETKLFIDGEYKMTISCGKIEGKSKKAIINRNSLKYQYKIEVKC